jgi:hypothetical protein
MERNMGKNPRKRKRTEKEHASHIIEKKKKFKLVFLFGLLRTALSFFLSFFLHTT